MRRDVMAGNNICNAIRGHLLDQQRPLYLQPKDTNGNYPWMQSERRFQPRPGIQPVYVLCALAHVQPAYYPLFVTQ